MTVILNERQFTDSAHRIKRLLIWKNGGKAPRSFRGWYLLCRDYGIELVEVPHPGFKARLLLTPWSAWQIYYNPLVPLRQRKKFLCHELAEYIALADYPSLFEGLPGTMGAYDGDVASEESETPEDFRHRLASRVEQMFFRR